MQRVHFQTLVLTIIFLLSLSWFLSPVHGQTPISLHPENPHYFKFRNKPILLITSAEHYGAVLNLDFDYLKYLDALQQQGMNNTRVFTGSNIEREQDIKWMGFNNTLAPKHGQVITPWARSTVNGYVGGGNKFNLNKWDVTYFERLKNFIIQAGKRGIIVELTFFGNNYKDEQWKFSPLCPDNNIQGEGPSGEKSFLIFQTLQNKQLVTRQELPVRSYSLKNW